MTPEILCIGNEIAFPAIQRCFWRNINPLRKKCLWLKLDSSSNQISMRGRNSPKDMLLWQIECSRYSIVESFMDGVAADFEKIHNRSFSPLFPILSSWTDRARCSNPVAQSPFGIFGDIIGGNIHRCLIIKGPIPGWLFWLTHLC